MFSTASIAILVASLVIYAAGLAVYNVLFHPLANIPGPRLAAVTRLWLFITDLSGKSSVTMLKWHQTHGTSEDVSNRMRQNCRWRRRLWPKGPRKQFLTCRLTRPTGPVIRVAPNEVSLYDIDAYLSELYAQNTKFTKAPYFYDAFNNPDGTVFSQLDRSAHSAEKRLMSHAFSRRNIVGLQHELYGHVHKWVDRLRAHVRAQRPIPLSRAAQCLTLDNVSYFSYGSDEGALGSENFQSELLEVFEAFPRLVTVFQFVPLLQPLVNLLQRFSSSSSSAARVTKVSLNRLLQPGTLMAARPCSRC